MLKFKQYIISEEYLFEAKESQWGLSKTDAGKMHEVLTGGLVNHYAKVYQQNKSKGDEAAHKAASAVISSPGMTKTKGGPSIANISHMEKFRDANGNKTAAEWHNTLSKGLSQEHYNEHLAHATHAATNIVNHMRSQGMTNIKKAHFTANANDIEKLTGGKDSSKKGNNSDIVVEHGHKEKGGGFHGVSLKSGGSSKLFNPGMGGITKVIDAAHEKATGKKGTMAAEVAKADSGATKAHHEVLTKHSSFLNSHFGKGHISSDKKAGTVNISDHALDTMRYAHERLNSKTPEKTRTQELKGISNEKVKKLGGVYGELQSAKLKSYKHPASESLHKHLKSIFSASGSGAKQAQHDVISSLTNTPVRDADSMRIMRHNTEYKKGQRTSKIAYGIGDAASKTHRYEVKRAGISNDIIGYDKKGNKTMHVSAVADASPSSGTGTGVRKGLHVWDKMKE